MLVFSPLKKLENTGSKTVVFPANSPQDKAGHVGKLQVLRLLLPDPDLGIQRKYQIEVERVSHSYDLDSPSNLWKDYHFFGIGQATTYPTLDENAASASQNSSQEMKAHGDLSKARADAIGRWTEESLVSIEQPKDPFTKGVNEKPAGSRWPDGGSPEKHRGSRPTREPQFGFVRRTMVVDSSSEGSDAGGKVDSKSERGDAVREEVSKEGGIAPVSSPPKDHHTSPQASHQASEPCIGSSPKSGPSSSAELHSNETTSALKMPPLEGFDDLANSKSASIEPLYSQNEWADGDTTGANDWERRQADTTSKRQRLVLIDPNSPPRQRQGITQSNVSNFGSLSMSMEPLTPSNRVEAKDPAQLIDVERTTSDSLVVPEPSSASALVDIESRDSLWPSIVSGSRNDSSMPPGAGPSGSVLQPTTSRRPPVLRIVSSKKSEGSKAPKAAKEFEPDSRSFHQTMRQGKPKPSKTATKERQSKIDEIWGTPGATHYHNDSDNVPQVQDPVHAASTKNKSAPGDQGQVSANPKGDKTRLDEEHLTSDPNYKDVTSEQKGSELRATLPYDHSNNHDENSPSRFVLPSMSGQADEVDSVAAASEMHRQNLIHSDAKSSLSRTTKSSPEKKHRETPFDYLRAKAINQINASRLKSGGTEKKTGKAPDSPSLHQLVRNEKDAASMGHGVIDILDSLVYFAGFVRLKIDVGRILFSRVDVPEERLKDIFTHDEWRQLFSGAAGLRSPPGIFTTCVTSVGEDTDYILNLKSQDGKALFGKEPFHQAVTYELVCLTRDNQFVFLTIGGDGAKQSVTERKTNLGAIHFHFPKRTWDARMTFDGTEFPADLGQGVHDALDAIVKNLHVPAGVESAQLYTQFEGKEIQKITTATVQYRTRHESSQYTGVYVEITETQDLDIGVHRMGRHMVKLAAKSRAELIHEHRLWYEISVSSTAVDAVLAENSTLKFGQRASWLPVDLVELGHIQQMMEVARCVVVEINGVGAYNNLLVEEATQASTQTEAKVKREVFW